MCLPGTFVIKTLLLLILIFLSGCGFQAELAEKFETNAEVSGGGFTLESDVETRGKTTMELEYEWTFHFTNGYGQQVGPCKVNWIPATSPISGYDESVSGCSDYAPAGMGYSVNVTVEASVPTPIFLEYCMRIKEPSSGYIEPQIFCSSAGEKAPPIPAPTIATPVANLNVNSTTQTITGVCRADHVVTLEGDLVGSPIDIPCNPSDDYSIVADVTAGDGAKTFTARQRNIAGVYSGSNSRTIILDTVANPITVTSPVSGSFVSSTTQTLVGTCEPSATVSISGALVTNPTIFFCPVSGNFSEVIGITAGDGAKAFSGSQTDVAGNISGPLAFNYTLDTAPSTVAIMVAPDINTTNVGSYALSGTCSENGREVTVVVGGISPAVQPSCGGGTWSVSGLNMVGAPEGSLTMTANHSDVAGNLSNDSTSINKDTVMPTVNIMVASNIGTGNENNYSLSGTCSENGRQVVVDVGGVTPGVQPTCSSGSWSVTGLNVSGASEGVVVITADHDDIVGNTIQDTQNVDKDTTAPTAPVVQSWTWMMNPASGSTSGNASPDITLSNAAAENGGSIQIHDNIGCSSARGSSQIIAAGGSSHTDINYATDGSADGVKAFYVIVTDDYGNASTCIDISLNYTLDTSLPSVAISVSPAISLSNQANYGFSGSCSENGREVTVSVEGLNPATQPTCTANTWSVSGMDVSSLADSATLTILADHEDIALNSAPQASVNVVKDTVAPTVPEIQAFTWTLSSPSNGALTDDVSPVIDLSGAASENGGAVQIYDDAICSSSQGSSQIITAGASNHNDILYSTLGSDDGAINFYVVIIDALGNASSCVDISRGYVLDTVVPTLAITSFPDINSTNVSNYSFSGTCSENGREVTVSVSFSSFPAVQPTCTGGTWSANVDASGEADGPLTLVADHSDAAGNPASQASQNITKNVINPTLTNLTSPNADGIYGLGETIDIVATFSENITVNGTPTITLDTGDTINMSSSTATTITFQYTVGAGDTSSDLTVTAMTAGTSIQDSVGNDAALAIPIAGSPNDLDENKDIIISGAAAPLALHFYIRQDCSGAPGPCWTTLSDFDPDAVTDSQLRNKNLVSQNVVITVHIDQAWTIDDTLPTGNVAHIQSWVTNSTRNITIQTEGVARHNGVASGNRYRIQAATVAPTFAHINIESDFITIDGIEIIGGSITTTSSEGIRVGADNTLLRNLLIHDFAAFSNTDAIHLEANSNGIINNSTTTVHNLIAYDMSRSCVLIQTKGGGNSDDIHLNVYNTTCHNVMSNGTSSGYQGIGVDLSSGTLSNVVVDVRNTFVTLHPSHTGTQYAFNLQGGSSWDPSSANNFSDDSTAPGNNAVINMIATDTPPVTTPGNPTIILNNLSAGLEDLHLQDVLYNSAQHGGSNLDTIFTEDIDGNTIVSWHVGADWTTDATNPETAITVAPDINTGNSNNYAFSGTCSDSGEEVTVSVGGINPGTQPICTSNYTWSVTGLDVSSLADGPVMILADHSDAALNNAAQASVNVTKTSCDSEVLTFTVGANNGTFDPQLTLVNGATVVWDFGDGSPSSSLSNPVHTYSGTPPYTVTATVSCEEDITAIIMHNDELIGTLPDISSLTSLINFQLYRNGFSGNFPSNYFDNNVALESIDFSYNSFTGVFPSNLFDNNLSLTFISFGNNSFTGSLPVGLFSNNSSLTSLQFASAGFTGGLSATTFSNNTGLGLLNFSNNSFGGTLPVGIFDNNSSLATLAFGGNGFSGNIDQDLVDGSPSLTRIYLEDNNFTSGFNLTNNPLLRTLYAHNNSFPSHVVDQFLIEAEAHGTSPFSSRIRLNGQLPSAPGASGHTAKTALEGRGWTVDVDAGTYTPLVAITSSPDIRDANDTSYNVSGTCSENSEEVTVSVGGITPTPQPTCSSGTWNIVGLNVAALADGTINITADHTGASGNSATQASVNVDKDVAAPTSGTIQSWTWSLTSPGNGSNSNDNTPVVSVSGAAVENGSDIQVFDNMVCSSSAGAAQTIAAGVTTHNDITYATDGSDDGLIAFYVEVTDAAGYTSSCTNISLAYTLDTVIPTVAITAPADINSVNVANYSLSGTCSENGRSVIVTVDGISPAVAPTCTGGAWSITGFDVSGASEGSINVIANHSDAAGNNAAPDTDPITKDTTGPSEATIQSWSWALSSPGDGAASTDNTPIITLSGAAAENGSTVQVYDNGTCTTQRGVTRTITAGGFTHNDITYATDGSDDEVKTYHVIVIDADSNLSACTDVSIGYTFDTIAPTFTAATMSINGGDVETLNNIIEVAFDATDNVGLITEFCLKYDNNTQPTGGDSCWKDVDAPDPGVTPAQSISVPATFIRVGFVEQVYTVYGFLKDEAGNISTHTSTNFQDQESISLVSNLAPEVANILVTSVAVPSDPQTSGDVTITAGNDVYIKWKASDADDGLRVAPNPINLYYTTDNISYTLIPGASNLLNGSNGGCAVDEAGTTADDDVTGCFIWSGGSPSSGFFRIRVEAFDTREVNTTQTSIALNDPNFRIIAGNTDRGIGNAAASVILSNDIGGSSDYDPGNMIFLPNGELYFSDINEGIIKVDPSTGNSEVYLPLGPDHTFEGAITNGVTTVTGVPYMFPDYQGRIIVYDTDRLRRIDPVANTITTIVGGGANADPDNVTPDNVQMESVDEFSFYINHSYFALPDGRIFFEIDNANPSMYYLDPVADRVFRETPTGTGSFGVPSFDFATTACNDSGKYFEHDLNVTSTTFTKIFYRYHRNSSGACSTANPDMINLNTSTYVIEAPHFDLPPYYETGYIHGMDGEIYSATRHGTSAVYKWNGASNDWDIVVGTETKGNCVDGTPALSCDVRIYDAFISQDGIIYVNDSGAIRTVDDDGNMKTLYGQKKNYGDGEQATSARFNNVRSFKVWDDSGTTKLVVLDKEESLFREFTVGGTIDTILGNGRAENINNGDLGATTGLYNSSQGPHFEMDPVNGNIFFHKSHQGGMSWRRSNDTWSRIYGAGGTNIATAGVTAATNIDSGSLYAPRYYGYDPATRKALVGEHAYSIPNAVDNALFILQYADSTHTSATFIPVIQSPGIESGATAMCTAGTANSSCSIRDMGQVDSDSDGFTGQYESNSDTWLLNEVQYEPKRIAQISESSPVSTFTTTINDIQTFEYRNDGGTEYIYYCGQDNILYSRNVTAGTESTLSISTPGVVCTGKDLYYDAARDSLYFIFEENGMMGIGEYLDP